MTEPIQPWIFQVIASIIGGGLAGGVLTICYNWWVNRQNSRVKETGVIASLAGEIRRCKAICDYNSRADLGTNVTFDHFPGAVAMDVTFNGRHLYPRLAGIQSELENYCMSLARTNQLIDLHNLMWISPEQPFASAFRSKLANQIVDLCKGNRGIEYGHENLFLLPKMIDLGLGRIEKLG